MTKTIINAQKRRGKSVRKKVKTILAKVYKLIEEIDGDDITNDAENLMHCLTQAKLALEDGEEHYTTHI